jgi:hypothetical protein
VNLSETLIIERLYSHRETIDPEIDESLYIFLIYIFRIGFEGDLSTNLIIKRETFKDFSDFRMRENGWGSASEIDGFYIFFVISTEFCIYGR